MLTKEQQEHYILESFEKAEETCTVPWVLNYANKLSGSSLKLHQVFMIVGGIAAVFNVAVAIYLMQGHARNWTKPKEQKQYV